jgi:hypothetical protein
MITNATKARWKTLVPDSSSAACKERFSQVTVEDEVILGHMVYFVVALGYLEGRNVNC